MRYLVNGEEMKIYDRNTMETYRVPSPVLMERAALAAAGEIVKRLPKSARVLIVCGSGNNGGDGYAVARLLLQEHCEVTVVCAADTTRQTKENQLQKEIWQAYGGEILSQIPEQGAYDAVVDAVFGVGLSRGVEGGYADLLARMNELSSFKIALDIPSGISSDNGAVLGTAFRADLTVTFAFEKTGTVLWPGNEYAGEVVVKDIGIDERSFLGRIPAVAAFEDVDLAGLPARTAHSNKGSFGKLLVIAGSVGMAGAACLCAEAAYICGCGLVRIVTPEENRTILQTKLPEAVLTTYSSAEGLETAGLAEAIGWADAVVCGPGLGTSDVARAIVETVLREAFVPVLLDADALNLIARDTGVLRQVQGEVVVTPHLGEMSRLCGESVAHIQSRLIETAKRFAEEYQVVCVLKDQHTVTSVPSHRTYPNLSGNAGMATAGSGDVLSGVIGSLMAQGLGAEDAAPLGVFLHGRAGDAVSERYSMRGLMASDLGEGLRLVLRETEQTERNRKV